MEVQNLIDFQQTKDAESLASKQLRGNPDSMRWGSNKSEFAIIKIRLITSNPFLRITSMACVSTGGVNLVLGTSNGEIIVIPDRLMLPKTELKVQR